MTVTREPHAALAPGGIPLIGHLFPVLRTRLDFLTSLQDVGPLVEIRLGPKPTLVVTDPEVLHHMLVTEGKSFDKGRFFEKARKFVGNGLATANTETHKVHRKMLQPAFHLRRIAGYATTMAEMTEATAESWQPGEVIDFGRTMDELVVTVVAKILFSTNLTDADVDAFHRCLPVMVGGAAVRALVPSGLLWLLPDNRRYWAAVKTIKGIVFRLINEYRRSGKDYGDLLSMIIAAQDDATGHQLGDQQVYDEVMTFMLGGLESSAAALSWIFYELANNWELEQRLHTELATVLAGRRPTFEDVAQLEFTNRLIKEAIRVYASTLLMRRVTTPVELGGVSLPVGTELIFSPYAVHRDRRWYPDPEKFDPDRWLPERAAEIHRDAYVPFGAGTRRCIGFAFAQTEIAIDIATIATRWRLRLVPGQRVRRIATAAVHPSTMLMACEPRN